MRHKMEYQKQSQPAPVSTQFAQEPSFSNQSFNQSFNHPPANMLAATIDTSDIKTVSLQLQAEVQASENLLREVVKMREELAVAQQAVADISSLYFAALVLSLKLKASTIGIPVTLEVNTLIEEVQERTVAMSDWPSWLAQRILLGTIPIIGV